ncbi:MAG: hypothetical protein CM15mV20_3320 [uncultured marine virus]|nr:MAG: hypothetical protein CM15mV20_3320 [uncultured marine virus]
MQDGYCNSVCQWHLYHMMIKVHLWLWVQYLRTTETQKLNVTGISTVVGVGTFKDDVYIDKKLYVAGIEIGGPGGPGIGTDITTRNLKVTGIATVTGNTDLNGDLDVLVHL